MASNLKSITLLLCLAVFLLLVASSSAISGSEVKAICSKAKNPGFCLGFFRSKPETAKADLPGVAKLTVDSARETASATLKEIQTLFKKAADPHSKGVYSSCSENYDEAVADLDDALVALEAGDSGTLNIRVSAALDQADTCEGDLKGSVSPDPSRIVKGSEDLQNVCSIGLVMSNMLPM